MKQLKEGKKKRGSNLHIEIENYVYDLHSNLKKNIWIVAKYGHK